MELYIAIGSAALSVASIILHIVAPRTKATWDDDLLSLIDRRIASNAPIAKRDA